MDRKNYVDMWEENVTIPTYSVGDADKNPMFLEKRVYQGSSGKVYPHPVIDKISDEKLDKNYKAVYLENEYLKIMILPEIGGRIQRAYDKTNDYDFVYYNQVIKPALVGLAGPWISGGIEFNWPQHHRPNTFGPVEYTLEENKDGSKTVWVSEIDRMYGTKGMAGFTLYPDKAYIEIKGQLYNRTAVPQTFLWWANPAVPVNDYTESVFPPDVNAVFDHGKRDVSSFPIATGTYYKMDYSAGVDISRYKNIPVPTSYMAYKSEFDFVGGYDYGKDAGVLHVANHHISPGKKQWTWGNGEFGQAWDRNLTDEDGPYIELMTGVFTDNQPDFTWLQPYEEKNFKQYFMPYKNIGVVKKANINVAVSLDVNGQDASVGVYTTGKYEDLNIVMKGKEKVYIDKTISLTPAETFNEVIVLLSNDTEKDLQIIVRSDEGLELVSYKSEEIEESAIPEAAKAIDAADKLENNEALYLAGLHIEQNRHATYEAEDYYLEGLRRDSNDIRINNAYGSLLFRRGAFEKSEKYFRNAVSTISRHNSNPYDAESYYNLGLSLKYQNKLKDAYNMFYKAVWEYRYQASGFYSIAQLDCINNDFDLALEHINEALIRNWHNMKARTLKSGILRRQNNLEEAMECAIESKKIDILDFGARYEMYLISCKLNNGEESELLGNLIEMMRNDPHNYIALSLDYSSAGLYDEAIRLLNIFVDNNKENNIYPMVYYYLANLNNKIGNNSEAKILSEKGMNSNSDYCFPNTIDDLVVLKEVLKINNEDSKAWYYLGNLLYDKKQYDGAVNAWENSANIEKEFPTVLRNLALAYWNKLNLPEKAKESLESAYRLNEEDARILLELDQLYKKLNVSGEERLEFLKKRFSVVEKRDDLFIEYVTLLNLSNDYEGAIKLIADRNFHPWEGGEGKIIKQFVYCHVEIAKKLIEEGNYQKAIDELKEALVYPENLGEGKLQGAQENDINYYLGCAYEALGEKEISKGYFINASVGLEEPTSAMYYNDQPPEMIFYQGLALAKLGEVSKSNSKFNKLIKYGENHMNDSVKIDYFAVSLPDLLIFDEDLNKRNRIHCNYLIALGNFGLSEFSESLEKFKEVLNLDKNNQGALVHIKMIN